MELTLLGRVRSVRMLGSKLMFVDIERGSHRLQIMIEVKKLENYEESLEVFKAFKKTVARGDWVCEWHSYNSLLVLSLTDRQPSMDALSERRPASFLF